jgi:hypothetical protein
MARSSATKMRQFLRKRNLEIVHKWIRTNQRNVRVLILKRFCRAFGIDPENLEKKGVILNPSFPVNMGSKGFLKLKSHASNEGRIGFGYKSVNLFTYNNQDPVLLMHFIDAVREVRGKIVGQPRWGTHVLEIVADVVLGRAIVASGLSYGRKTRTNPSLDSSIIQDPKLFSYHIQATLNEEGWCSLKIDKRRATFDLAWGRAVDITNSLSKEQIDEIQEIVAKRRRRKIPIKSIDPKLYRTILLNPPRLFDQEITLLNYAHIQKDEFEGIPTKVHLSKENRITAFWGIHFNRPELIDIFHNEYGMLPGTWKAKRFENLYKAYKEFRGRRLTDEEITKVRKVKEENPPKVSTEWISEKMRELFPSVERGSDLEWIRKKLGRKKKQVKELVEGAFRHFGKNKIYERQFIRYFKNKGMNVKEVDQLWVKANAMNIIEIGVIPIAREEDPLKILGHVTVFTLKGKEEE